MIRLLVTNGCSCARGEELTNPTVDAWPSVLARRLGVELVNLARDGSSNRRIVRTVVEWLPVILRERSLSPADVLVLVAWTEAARHEHFARRLGPFAGGQTVVPFDKDWHTLASWREREGDRPSATFYEHLWSTEGQLTNLFLDWTMMDGLLRYWGVHTRYAFTFPIPRRLPKEARHLAGSLDASHTFGGIPNRSGTAFLQMPREHDRGPGSHPLESGHRWFASVLVDWLLADASLVPLLQNSDEAMGEESA